jgi:putative phosphoesterase
VLVVIMSDTHLPKRAKDLPGPLWMMVDEADVVVHAGDWVEVELLDRLEARSRRLVAVYGNNDGPALRSRLPEVARANLDGLRLAVVHETGAATGREARCAARFPDTDVLVFGQRNMSKPRTVTRPGQRAGRSRRRGRPALPSGVLRGRGRPGSILWLASSKVYVEKSQRPHVARARVARPGGAQLELRSAQPLGGRPSIPLQWLTFTYPQPTA